MAEISKADWKLFCERVPEWQEHYMERLTKKYIEILSSPGNASDHFWEVEKRIKNETVVLLSKEIDISAGKLRVEMSVEDMDLSVAHGKT